MRQLFTKFVNKKIEEEKDKNDRTVEISGR